MSLASVVSVGAVTPIGLTAKQTGFLLRAGLPAMAEAPLADAAGEPITMGFLPTLDPRLVGAPRLAELARAAFEEASSPIRDRAADVFVSIDDGGPDAAIAGPLLEAMITRLMPQARVTVDAGGEAGPGERVEAALRSLHSKSTDIVIIGGVHSDYDPRVIAALDADGRLFSRDNLDARIPGEAAAFFVLMRADGAARYGLAPLARVVGVGVAREEAGPENDEPAYAARGLTEAVRRATSSLIEAGELAGWVFNDVTGEMRRLHEWQTAFTRAQRALGRPYHIESPALRVGHLGAAALPLFVAVAATAWAHGYAPSSIALATVGADSGGRAALVIREA